MANEFAMISAKNFLDSALSVTVLNTPANDSVDVEPVANLAKRGLSDPWIRGPLSPGDTFWVTIFQGADHFGKVDTVAFLDMRFGSLSSVLNSRSAYNPDLLPQVEVDGYTFSGTSRWTQSFPYYDYTHLSDIAIPSNQYLLMPVEQASDTGKIILKFTVPMDTPDGLYLYIGRLWLGERLEIPRGVDTNWTLAHYDAGSLTASQGGQYYANLKYKYRVVSANMTLLDAKLAYGYDETNDGDRDFNYWNNLQKCAYDIGATGDGIFAPRCSTPFWMARTAIYGHPTNNPGIVITAGEGGYYSCNLTFTEEV